MEEKKRQGEKKQQREKKQGKRGRLLQSGDRTATGDRQVCRQDVILSEQVQKGVRPERRSGIRPGVRRTAAILLAAMMAAAVITGCGASSSSSSSSSQAVASSSYSSGTSAARYTTGLAVTNEAASYETASNDAEMEAYDAAGESAEVYDDGDADSGDYDNSDNDVSNDASNDVSSDADAAAIRKKIVYSGDVYLETKEYDEAKQQLSALISQYGGFVESSSEYDNGSDTQSQRSYYVTAKIPAAHFDDFMNGLGDVSGKITSKSISSEDMTRTYSDNADRIEALETEQKTLLELLAKADSVDAMIAIQKELTDVRAELAQLHHANSGIDYDVRYSSVSISLDEVVTYTPTQVGFGERIRDAFGESGQSFVDFLQWLVVAVIFLLPYIVIIVVVVLIVRKVRKKRRNRKNNSARQDAKMPPAGTKAEETPTGTENAGVTGAAGDTGNTETAGNTGAARSADKVDGKKAPSRHK